VLSRRGQLLRAAFGFVRLPRPSYDRTLWALRNWLDSWAGIGRVAVGMAHQGFDLQLTRYDERGCRATFYVTGMEHSPGVHPSQLLDVYVESGGSEQQARHTWERTPRLLKGAPKGWRVSTHTPGSHRRARKECLTLLKISRSPR
jgi:hypothetical protein